MCWCHYRTSRCSRCCRTSWGCGSAGSGSAAEVAVAERGIDRTRRGKESVHLSRASSTRWDMLCNSCTSNIRRQSAPSRCIGNRCRRLGCGCASRDSGCAMSAEVRNPRSRCRGCRQYTGLRAHHRRNHHQRRSCRCLSIVPLWESGRADCADGGRAASGCAASGCADRNCRRNWRDCGCG
jgi:hypothetical protein